MPNRRVVRLLCVYPGLWLIGCLVWATPAAAQIYTWRDANGHLVLSNRPAEGGDRSYVVPQASSVRATRPVAPAHGQEFTDLIVEQANANAVRPDLVRAVVQVESAFNPNAKSVKGALGLMQLMPETIRHFGVGNPFNPGENIRAGVAYLRQLLDRYGNNEQLALAAYNAGPGAVDRHDQTVPPYVETQHYVARINSLAVGPVLPPHPPIYKSIDLVDGRAVPKFSDTPPSSGPYEIRK